MAGPAPVPTDVITLPATDSDGNKWVAVKIRSATGEAAYFWTPDQADEIADRLHQLADKQRGTLTTRPSRLIVPHPVL